MYSTVNLLLLLAAWASFAWAIAFGVPLYARAAFTERVSALHDEIADAVLRRELPADEPAVNDFLTITRAMSLRPQAFGMSEALAVHLAHTEFGHTSACEPFSYSELNPAGRKLMHNADEALNAALRPYMVFGSRFWLLFTLFFGLRRTAYKLRMVAAPEPREKATAKPLVLSADELADDIRQDAKRRVNDLGLGPVAIRV